MREVLMISPTAINSSSVAGIVKELGIPSRYISNPVVSHHFLEQKLQFWGILPFAQGTGFDLGQCNLPGESTRFSKEFHLQLKLGKFPVPCVL